MRENEYRGKRIDNGEFEFGYYLLVGGISYILPKGKFLNDIIEVEPATVGQYTDLTDKNGVKIFEGDIVRYIYEPGESFWNANQLSVVVWEHTGFKLDGIIGTNKFALLNGWLVSVPCDKNFFEVIGNIHDTPELLEWKKEGFDSNGKGLHDVQRGISHFE